MKKTALSIIANKLRLDNLNSTEREHLFMTSYLFGVLSDTVNQISQRKEQRIKKTPKSYKCIHKDLGTFLRDFANIMRELRVHPHRNRLKFLDVGCGVAEKVYAAWQLGFESFGLEFRPESVQVARQIARRFGIITHDFEIAFANRTNYTDPIIHSDALKFQDYNKFDVIYFYRPFIDVASQLALEKRILRQMKPGAILVAYLSESTTMCQSDFEQLCKEFTIKEHRNREGWSAFVVKKLNPV